MITAITPARRWNRNSTCWTSGQGFGQLVVGPGVRGIGGDRAGPVPPSVREEISMGPTSSALDHGQSRTAATASISTNWSS